MNFALTKEIVNHILSNFGIIDLGFVDKTKTKSLFSKDLLIKKYDNNLLYGCTIELQHDKKLNIIGADIDFDGCQEFALLLLSSDNIGYGIYSSFDDESVIGIYLKDWGLADTYSQAMLLLLSEEVRQFGFNYSKLEINDQISNVFDNFLIYVEEFYEQNARQEG